MTSRERMIAALTCQDVDYVPLSQSFSASLTGPQYTWDGRTDSLDLVVNHLGLDPTVNLDSPVRIHPDVKQTVWTEKTPEGHVIHKRFDTPEGPLTAAVRVTDDLELRNDIALYSDWNVSRFVKPWFTEPADVERFKYVYMPPGDEEIKRAREVYQRAKARADQYGLMTYATVGKGLTGTLQMWGAQEAVLASVDTPEMVQRYLDIEHTTSMRQIELHNECGVDCMRRNGFYETTDFWSPTQLRRFVVPQIKEEIAAMKQGGAVTSYTVETGIMPMLDILAELEFDSYNAIEPVLGHQDMAVVAERLGKTHAIWGGVSGPIHIGEGTPEIARQAVRDAFATFGRRGFVLDAVPSIRAHWPWENALAMFDEWKKLRAG